MNDDRKFPLRDRFAPARAIADALFFDGRAPDPHRPSATKNELRLPFGVLAPRAASEAAGSDPWWTETQILVAAEPSPRVLIHGKLRFFRARVASVAAGGRLLVPEGDARPALALLTPEACKALATAQYRIRLPIGGERSATAMMP